MNQTSLQTETVNYACKYRPALLQSFLISTEALAHIIWDAGLCE